MNKTFFTLPLMLFLHIVDDYYLQGILASMKQKGWWETHSSDIFYKNDYKIALAIHAFSWAFMIMLPIATYYQFNPPALYFCVLFVNWAVHAITDHLKANLKKINLVEDQAIHIIQIVFTYTLWI